MKLVVKTEVAKQMTSYPVLITSNLLQRASKWLPITLKGSLVIVTDNTVKKLYGSQLAHSLRKNGRKVIIISFPAGERSKNYEVKQTIESMMLKNYCDRNTILLALGGGVVGDMAGFIAATYMRGISYIQIPTTFLSMIDSSIGGKTGINVAEGKNLIGAFWQPKMVIGDIACLKSLPKKQLINGLIEALKIFLTSDAKSFNYLKNNIEQLLMLDQSIVNKVIVKAIKLKSDIVNRDVNETGQRATLNFGHTIGHALEKASQYKILHGYAVALGILVEAKISQQLGLLDARHYSLIQSVIERLGILADELRNFDCNEIVNLTKIDKKARKGQAQYVLLESFGKIHAKGGSFTFSVSDKIVKKAFLEISEKRVYAGK